MKFVIGLCGLVLLLMAGGCAVEPTYSGYGGNVYGEYGYGTAYPYYYNTYPYGYHYRYAPYDRDHYWDRDRYWDRHRYPYDHRWDWH